MNREQQHCILTCTREIVANYIEAYQKYDVIKIKICDGIAIRTAVWIAKTYFERHNAKTSPEADTPLSVNSSLIDVTLSELGLFTEPSDEATEHKSHSRKGKKGVTLTTMTENDEDVARPMASTMTGATKRVVHPSAPKNWYDRVSAQCTWNEDLWKYDESKIPDQGVVFNNHYPWDVWTAHGRPPKENEEPRGWPPTPPPKDRPHHVMIQSPRSRVAYPTRWLNWPDPLVVDQGNEDLPSPAQSHRSNRHGHRDVQRHRSPTPDTGPNTIPILTPPPLPLAEQNEASWCHWHLQFIWLPQG